VRGEHITRAHDGDMTAVLRPPGDQALHPSPVLYVDRVRADALSRTDSEDAEGAGVVAAQQNARP
jgi:hypothetical protein